MDKNIAIVLGSNHHNTLGLIRSLAMAKVKVYLYLITSSKDFVSKSKYLTKTFYCKDEEECFDDLSSRFNMMKHKPVLYPCTDNFSLFIDKFKSQLVNSFFIPFTYKKQGIKTFMNKKEAALIAKDAGFNIPNTYEITLNNIDIFMRDILPEINYKTILKPLKSVLGIKDDITICKDQRELSQQLTRLVNLFGAVLLQEFIEKEYEVTILGVSLKDGTVIVPGVLKKIDEYPLEKGSGTFGQYVQNIDKDLLLNISKIIHSMGFVGLFSIDMLKTKHLDFFIEINLRNDANSYASTKGGVNLPYILYKDLIGTKFDLTATKIKKDMYVMCEFSDLAYSIRVKHSIYHWFRNVLRTDCFMVWSRKDCKPFLFKIINRIYG